MKSPFINFGMMVQKELPMHRNAGMELVYVAQGRLRWRVEGRLEEVAAGSIFFTLPWQAHGSEHLHEPGNRICFVQCALDRNYRSPVRNFGFHSALGVPASDARRMSLALSGTDRHRWPASKTLAWLMRTLVERLEVEGFSLLSRGLFLSLLAELENTLRTAPSESLYTNPTERRVLRLADQLETHCDRDWNLLRMLEDTGLGATQLTALFKRLTGDSPVAYLKRVRVMKAEHLLTTTERSITDIALECGFSTTPAFCRTFRAFTNRSATAYRREAPARADQPVQDWSAQDERKRRAALLRQEWV